MADIAFLLLVFFLLVSTIDVDHGISAQIEKPSENVENESIHQTVLLLRKDGQLMCNGDLIQSDVLELKLLESYSTKKKVKNVLMFSCEREVDYITFINCLDQVKESFSLFRDHVAADRYAVSWQELEPQFQATILDEHPIVLAEDVIE